MSATPKQLTTRIFRAGNSQAVRIPKAFELPGGEAVIEQRSGGLFIKQRRGGWDEFFSKPPLAIDLDARELRATAPDDDVLLTLAPNRQRPARKRKQVRRTK